MFSRKKVEGVKSVGFFKTVMSQMLALFYAFYARTIKLNENFFPITVPISTYSFHFKTINKPLKAIVKETAFFIH